MLYNIKKLPKKGLQLKKELNAINSRTKEGTETVGNDAEHSRVDLGLCSKGKEAGQKPGIGR